ncbi:GntR family transcriptional regulator [Roseomonas sp. SSH11]|uniref:GntR family transcriptional regulator n=2 Tax=Pararoseomonas baculiformis TaxID=2820812 RepID=A0ABS4AEY4_9PROT|nr:GntR family transcriptional regulator [Pararoseomonas baculiformis]
MAWTFCAWLIDVYLIRINDERVFASGAPSWQKGSMPRPSAAALHRGLARSITDHLRASGAVPGCGVGETALAQALGTSRAPVRGALHLLLQAGTLERMPTGRLRLRQLPAAGTELGVPSEEDDAAERLYWRMAADRLGGVLPDLVGEAALMRRYDAPRGLVHKVLLHMLGEGWIERRPAGAWRFVALIEGPDSYDEAYRFRRSIEPAALLEPGFALAAPVLERLRQEQEDLLQRADTSPDPREVFEANAGFHLALLEASNNRFFADAGRRMTRLRRVATYYLISTDRARLPTQSREHLAILERIDAGDQVGAAALLTRHLDDQHATKMRLLAEAKHAVHQLTRVPTSQPDKAKQES